MGLYCSAGPLPVSVLMQTALHQSLRQLSGGRSAHQVSLFRLLETHIECTERKLTKVHIPLCDKPPAHSSIQNSGERRIKATTRVEDASVLHTQISAGLCNEGLCSSGMPGVGNVSIVDGQSGVEAGQLSLQAGGQLQRGSLLTLKPRHNAPLSVRATAD